MSAQEFNYVHYDTKDGLAGTTVYCMCEDEDGFKWFGTENGLSRFDGTRFVNFTVAEGLPDNEVLELLGDQKGRVWISTFSKQLCYYYKGKIHNAQNTPWLKKFKLQGPVTKIASDNKGNLIFSDYYNLYWLDRNDSLDNLNETPLFKKYLFRGHFVSDFDHNDNLILSTWDSIFTYKDGILKKIDLKRIPQASSGQFALYSGIGSPTLTLPEPNVLQKITHSNHRPVYLATSNGAWAVDTSANVLGQHFLPGMVVSDVIMGDEKNLWFATMGNGVYKLPSTETRTVRFGRDGSKRREVYTIMHWQNKFYCGLNFSETSVLNESLFEIERINLKSETIKATNNYATNRQTSSLAFDEQTAFLGFDAFIVKLVNGKKQSLSPITAIKCIEKIDPQHILVGNHVGAYKIRVHDMKTVDTVWQSRVTKAVYHNGSYYLGTTNGLFRKNVKGSVDTLSNLHPALSRRISGIATQGKYVWISSSDKGIVVLDGKKIIAALSKANGLSSDICRSIYASGNHVWVGTNNGLNKVVYSGGKIAITKFGTYDGLPSEIIDAILEKDSLVFIGTSEGITFFNEKKLTTNSTCKLHILGVRPAKEYELFNDKYYLPYNHNTIGVDYTAISFRSAGDIQYFYRLKGLNEEWQVTRNQNLEFTALPPGEYTLELQAVNRFGVKSAMIPLTFVIDTPFWRTWWFITLAALVAVFATVYLLNRRNEKQKQRLEQKMEIEKKLAELEQQALQAQMNPHFIFNCLNSIQQYFLTNDGAKANKFLSMFAALVRETLHFSSQKSIRVSDEVRYISRYLEMEKMRFGDHFVYEINVDTNLPINFVEIPALLLQPYVENAIRHGVRHRKAGDGIVHISFEMKGEEFHCIIGDNGIGREKSRAMRGRQPVEYQSRGMELGQKRIEALNKVYQREIKVEIKDLKDDQGSALGTEVHLIIPV
jgi:hypothetical protein